MGYNSGVVTLFNQNTSPANLLVTQNSTVFNKRNAAPVWTSLTGQAVSPALITSAAISLSSAYGQQIFGSSAASATISSVYALNISMSLLSGTVSNAYSLYVTAPTVTSGTSGNLCTAFFGLPSVGTNQGGVGIGTLTPTNDLDVFGGVGLGSNAGSQTISFGVVAISNQSSSSACLGVRTSSPNYLADVQGTLQAGAAYGWMPMGVQQMVTLSEGWGQSSLGGGLVGSNLGFNSNTIALANPRTISQSASYFFSGSVFDGRYIYYFPEDFTTGPTPGILTRYDTYLSFSATTSYSSFNMLTVNSLATQCYGGCFDGRYVYITTWQIVIFGALAYTFIRYDTWSPFQNISSYQTFDTRNINSNFLGLQPCFFDGRYVYIGSVNKALLARYDTLLSFTSSSSYAYFDLSTLVSIINQQVNFIGFDGQFIYIGGPSGPTSNYVVAYNTSLSFGSAASYSTFDISQISGLSVNTFEGASFDGRYLYFCPSGNTFNLFSGQILRYDTTLSFTATTSYAFVDLSVLNTRATGFTAILFDGKYIYLCPGNTAFLGAGILSRYDTSMAFNITAGFDFLDFTSVNSNNGGNSLTFDGKYVYLAAGGISLITRINAYPGPQTSPLFSSNQASNGFTLGMGVTNLLMSPTVSSGTFQIPSLPVGYIQIQGGQGIIRKIPYYN